MAKTRTLSKTDFILGCDCPAKLYYKKQGFQSTHSDNGYLSFLAEGGYLIGAVAKVYFPNGIEIGKHVKAPGAVSQQSTDFALAQTRELLQRENVVLYEPAFQVGKRLVRVDVLVKNGERVDLYEVKSKSQSSEHTQWNRSEWGKYLDDLAYQWLVVRRAMPEVEVHPYLMTPDKDCVASVDNLHKLFHLEEQESLGSYRDVTVTFTGDEKVAEEIRQSGLMRAWDVRSELNDSSEVVDAKAADFESWLEDGDLTHPRPPLGKHCFRCEYDTKIDDASASGFAQCWGKLAQGDRHIKDLYKVGALGGAKNPLANQWIADGLVGQDDIDVSGLDGPTVERVAVQIQCTRKNEEWLDKQAISEEISAWSYPLHFVDFETSASPLPYQSGLKPFEIVPFQWSCHSIAAPGDDPVHRDFISASGLHPGTEFLTTLREAVGDVGTMLIWSKYERTQLRNLAKRVCNGLHEVDADTTKWLNDLVTSMDREKVDDQIRLVDQHELVVKYWFHPLMKNRTSLKVALPSALQSAAKGRIDVWLGELGYMEVSGVRSINPYAKLPTLEIAGGDELRSEHVSVTDGVEAMRAYQEMLYGRHMSDPSYGAAIKESLRRYCQLDTLSQVIVWEHWRQLVEEQ